jgi:hypothetical protein
MKVITTKKELIKELENLNDNDLVVIEVHDTVLHEDLYSFYVDVIGGIKLNNGETVNEIRFTAIPHKEN